METVTRFIVALKSIDASQNKCLSSLTLGRTNPSISLGWAETQFTCLGYLLSKSHAPNIDRALRVRAYLIRCKFTVTHDIHSQQSNVCDGPNDVDSPKHRTAKSNYGQIEYELGFVAARPMHCVFHLKLFVFFFRSIRTKWLIFRLTEQFPHDAGSTCASYSGKSGEKLNFYLCEIDLCQNLHEDLTFSHRHWIHYTLSHPIAALEIMEKNIVYEMGPLERALAMTKAAYNL